MTDFVLCENETTKGRAELPQAALDSDQYPGWAPVTEAPADPFPGTVDEVLAAVGDDPTLAAQALAVEQSRPKARTTLVDSLTTLTSP